MAFPKYESYKDSGVEWLCEIPSHWEVKPGRAYFKPQKIKNIGNKINTVLSLSYGKIVIKPEKKLHGLVPESFETYQIVSPGNIIIRATDLQNDHTSLRVGLVEDEGIITSAYLCLALSDKLNSKSAYYLLHSYDLLKVYYGMGSGLRQNLDFTDFKYLPLAVPELEEQKRIAVFLDCKTAEVDEAIAKKQHLIKLLQEQKAILINQAVTKGLNPHAPMRDSGVEWIGEIPEHWNVLPLTKYVKSTVDYRGKTPTKVEAGIFLVTAKNIKNGIIDYEISKEYVAVNEYEQIMSRGKPKIDDLLFTTEAPLGSVALVDREDIALAQRIIKFRLNEKYLIPKFTHYSMMSLYFQEYLLSEATGSTAEGIKASKLHKLRIIVPPLDEQQQIVDSLKSINTAIDEVINLKYRIIETLKELKQILIFNVVIGKIKV